MVSIRAVAKTCLNLHILVWINPFWVCWKELNFPGKIEEENSNPMQCENLANSQEILYYSDNQYMGRFRSPIEGFEMNGSRENRESLRVPVNLRVRIATGESGEFRDAYSRNLSETGMFVQTATPPEKGSRVKFEIIVRTKSGDKVMRGTGEVVWRRTPRDGLEQVRPSGMGIRFRVLDDASKALVKNVIERFVARHPELENPHGQTARPVDKPEGKGKDRRIAPRATAGMSALYRCEGDSSPRHGHVINISSTGVFIRTKEPAPSNASIDFEIQLPNDLGEVRGSGIIAWQVPMALPGERPRIPGMGIKFSDLTEESKRILNHALSEHLLGPFVDSTKSESVTIPQKKDDTASKDSVTRELPDADDGDGQSPSEPIQTPEGTDSTEQISMGLSIQMEVQAEPGGRAASLEGMALRKWVVNSLVAAVEIARLPEFANTETIQYLLTSWCQDFLNGTSVDLTMFWNMLLSETGVTVEEAAVPVEIFYVARHEHGFGMLMPEGFESLCNVEKIQLKAENLLRASDGFLKIVDKVASRPIEGLEEQIVTYEHHAQAQRKKSSAKSVGKHHAVKHTVRWKAVAALVFMGLALGIAGAAALSVFQTKASDVDISRLEDVLVLKDALQKGDTISAFVDDPRWKEMTESERRDSVVELSDKLALEGIMRMTLFDETGVVCVAVAPSDEGQRVILLGDEVYDQSGQDSSNSN